MRSVSIILTLILATFIAGCSQTVYKPLAAQGGEGETMFDRDVYYQVSPALYNEAPDCVVIWPLVMTGLSEKSIFGQLQNINSLIINVNIFHKSVFLDFPDRPMTDQSFRARAVALENAVALHLRGHIQRVIAPHERDRLSRGYALDLSRPSDQAIFARKEKCRYGVDVQSALFESSYLIIWSQYKVSLELILRKSDSGVELWRASHQARRGSGGIVLSPLAVAFNVTEASGNQADQDVLPSLIDDALRRMLITFPDFR